jgi:hypothetical protein
MSFASFASKSLIASGFDDDGAVAPGRELIRGDAKVFAECIAAAMGISTTLFEAHGVQIRRMRSDGNSGRG